MKAITRMIRGEHGSMQMLTISFIAAVAVTFVPIMLTLNDIIDQKTHMTIVAQQAAYGASGQTAMSPGAGSLRINAAGAKSTAHNIIRANLESNTSQAAEGGITSRAWMRVYNPITTFGNSKVLNPHCRADYGHGGSRTIQAMHDGAANVLIEINPAAITMAPTTNPNVLSQDGFVTATEDRNSCWIDKLLTDNNTTSGQGGEFDDEDGYYKGFDEQLGLLGIYNRVPGVAVEIESNVDLCKFPLMEALYGEQKPGSAVKTATTCNSLLKIHSYGAATYTYENLKEPEPYLVVKIDSAVKAEDAGITSGADITFTWDIPNWALDDRAGVNPNFTCVLQKLDESDNVISTRTISPCTDPANPSLMKLTGLSAGKYRIQTRAIVPKGEGSSDTLVLASNWLTWTVDPKYNDIEISIDGEYEEPSWKDTQSDSTAIDWEVTGTGINSVKCTVTVTPAGPKEFIPNYYHNDVEVIPNQEVYNCSDFTAYTGPRPTFANDHIYPWVARDWYNSQGGGTMTPAASGANVAATGQLAARNLRWGHARYVFVITAKASNGAQRSGRFILQTPPHAHKWKMNTSATNTKMVDANAANYNYNMTFNVNITDSWSNNSTNWFDQTVNKQSLDGDDRGEYGTFCRIEKKKISGTDNEWEPIPSLRFAGAGCFAPGSSSKSISFTTTGANGPTPVGYLYRLYAKATSIQSDEDEELVVESNKLSLAAPDVTVNHSSTPAPHAAGHTYAGLKFAGAQDLSDVQIINQSCKMSVGYWYTEPKEQSTVRTLNTTTAAGGRIAVAGESWPVTVTVGDTTVTKTRTQYYYQVYDKTTLVKWSDKHYVQPNSMTPADGPCASSYTPDNTGLVKMGFPNATLNALRNVPPGHPDDVGSPRSEFCLFSTWKIKFKVDGKEYLSPPISFNWEFKQSNESAKFNCSDTGTNTERINQTTTVTNGAAYRGSEKAYTRDT